MGSTLEDSRAVGGSSPPSQGVEDPLHGLGPGQSASREGPQPETVCDRYGGSSESKTPHNAPERALYDLEPTLPQAYLMAALGPGPSFLMKDPLDNPILRSLTMAYTPKAPRQGEQAHHEGSLRIIGAHFSSSGSTLT